MYEGLYKYVWFDLICGTVLCDKTAHFRVAFYCPQHKVHLCNGHAIQSTSWYATPVRWMDYLGKGEMLTNRDYHLFFNRTMTQHTSRLCKGYLTKKESDGVLHQMTWPPQSPDLNPIEMVWEELDRKTKEKQAKSAQHMWELLQDCMEKYSRGSWLRECQECAKLLSRQRVSTLKNLKYI